MRDFLFTLSLIKPDIRKTKAANYLAAL